MLGLSPLFLRQIGRSSWTKKGAYAWYLFRDCLSTQFVALLKIALLSPSCVVSWLNFVVALTLCILFGYLSSEFRSHLIRCWRSLIGTCQSCRLDWRFTCPNWVGLDCAHTWSRRSRFGWLENIVYYRAPYRWSYHACAIPDLGVEAGSLEQIIDEDLSQAASTWTPPPFMRLSLWTRAKILVIAFLNRCTWKNGPSCIVKIRYCRYRSELGSDSFPCSI